MPTAGELHPTDGVRLVLELGEVEGEGAEYAAWIYTPEHGFAYRARLASDGTAELEAIGEAAAAEDEKRLENLARSIARAAGRKAEEGLRPWPARVMRWRR